MKKLIFLLVASIAACTKDCPECYNFAEPLRLAILNSQDVNLLDPSQNNGLTIDMLKLSSGEKLDFVIKDYIIPSEPIGFYHLESIDDDFFDNCIDKECEFYITYSNSTDIDTINVLIEKEVNKEHRCKCVAFPYRYIKHNGEVITEYDWEPNNTGSAIIRK